MGWKFGVPVLYVWFIVTGLQTLVQLGINTCYFIAVYRSNTECLKVTKR